MAVVKTYLVRFDSAGNIVSTKEIDIEASPSQMVVVVLAKNVTNANKAALALRGE